MHNTAAKLKAHVHGTAEVGQQFDQCIKMTKAIGDYVERTFGCETKRLAIHEEESDPKKLMCPVDKNDRKQFGFPLRDLGKDHALGSDQCPETMEGALEVLPICAEKQKLKADESGDDKRKVHMVQTGKASKKMVCWNCREKGHGVKTCPKRAAREESDNENIHAQTSNAAEMHE